MVGGAHPTAEGLPWIGGGAAAGEPGSSEGRYDEGPALAQGDEGQRHEDQDAFTV